jgi:serine/threonine-protein kinase
VSNALDVQFMPPAVRGWWQTGDARPPLERPRGEWLARRLGAPERSRAAGGAGPRHRGGPRRGGGRALRGAAGGAPRAARGAARRRSPRSRPGPPTRARGSTALARVAPVGPGRRRRCSRRVGGRPRRTSRTSVAALEGIRLDLLRLHADAGDLAPLTTLIDAARLIGADVGRPAGADGAADAAAGARRAGAARVAAPG